MDSLQLQFIHAELLKGFRQIFRAQIDIAEHRIYREGHEQRVIQGKGRTVRVLTGHLQDSLHSPHFNLEAGSLGVHGFIDYPVYIRFLDMKNHGNFKIYNRQIWGILYSETFNRIRYEYRQEVRDWLYNHIKELTNQLTHK